ncbi:triose-phosphate isomerase family protein [Glaciihabitans sp. dw_435]|uniref:triose-phosphate isomerase family protein n=1 Tax=Glaciihabitans sp. dw_435 TaxID=2720081 RepID=UPI0027DD7C69|nr:triose-phosphate isomerase family protein [Glaciihabitans sp. dw_435]
MPSTIFVGVSTKAYFGFAQTLDWLSELRDTVVARPELATNGVIPFVIPSAPLLPRSVALLAGTGVLVGAQDLGYSTGAFTGETPAPMLAEIGVRIAEIGHAERRSLFHETDEVIERKHAAATAAGLTSLLCVGELDVSTPEEAARFCFDQITAVVPSAQTADVLIAYEPVWAIGADAPAAPDYVNAVIHELRALVVARYPDLGVSFIYGGSAGPGLLPLLSELDGIFLGRFGHDIGNLAAVLDEALALTTSSTPTPDNKKVAS